MRLSKKRSVILAAGFYIVIFIYLSAINSIILVYNIINAAILTSLVVGMLILFKNYFYDQLDFSRVSESSSTTRTSNWSTVFSSSMDIGSKTTTSPARQRRTRNGTRREGGVDRSSRDEIARIEKRSSNSRKLLKKIISAESKTRWQFTKGGDTCWSCGAELTVESMTCADCGSRRIICFICRRNIDYDDRIGAYPACGNHFHYEHLREAVKVSGKCPMCLQNVKTDGVIELGLETAI